MTQSSNPADQRAHKRLSERIRVEFRLLGTSAAIQNMPFMETQSRDISAGGLFIELLGTHITSQKQSVVDDFLLFKSELPPYCASDPNHSHSRAGQSGLDRLWRTTVE
jgi:hypothetical protein